MERQNPLTSALQSMGIISLYDNENELEHLKAIKELEHEYSWKVTELDLKLINGYYLSDGLKADEVLQTPFENYCVTKIGDKYELFKIGCSYRPVVVPFKENLEIKQWLEEKLEHVV